ncbi:MAG: Spy/CpxP family protein refolding chaperone [Gemmatimonadota bacterium]|nr:MAG: Spy/CpxP family protein refolding chaperone [Gemmatimonadota bacterium]
MNTKMAALGMAVALALSLSVAGDSRAQEPGNNPAVGQDTTRTARGFRGPRAGGWFGRAMRPGGARGAGFMRGGGFGPRMMVALKDELGLSDEQVSRLDKIHEDHRALMQAQMQNLHDLAVKMREAREQRDWDALEKAIDERAKLESGMARGLLNVERQSLEVLSDEQRQKFETWGEGARLFRHQGPRHRHEMRGERLEQRPCRQGRDISPGLAR